MSEKTLKIGISQGNPNGIASELILKTFENSGIYDMCTPVLYGSSKILAYYRKLMDLAPINVSNMRDVDVPGSNRLNAVNVIPEEFLVETGRLTDESVQAADESLKKVCEDLKNGLVDVLVTLPATSIDAAEALFPEQKDEALKIMVHDTLRIALATDAVPLSDVKPLITVEKITERIKSLQSALIHDFMITSPRIAVLALNPQSGQEEAEIIRPAIQEATKDKVFCFGPYAADQFFGTDAPKNFDAILAMYYDQGMVAFQSMTAGQGIVYTANLPFVITAPAQGLYLEKAGKNECEPDAFRQAIYLATTLHQNRQSDKEIRKNPLKKQYFERGSDNEKLDLTSSY
ncbi:MAG: 4-hydroxythreonine-4-phosphate dehydrogenase PdxA [Candidatus Symbiothrix sp.]|jgi:4-hydroxythreonine-4-phosphate dehydrogenase|nr:4-hydroxythreonine-4-phosphate dehydrogenase PdxA [Candidatus Symbiothrix sp.]